jgi:hypothetical protein
VCSQETSPPECEAVPPETSQRDDSQKDSPAEPLPVVKQSTDGPPSPKAASASKEAAGKPVAPKAEKVPAKAAPAAKATAQKPVAAKAPASLKKVFAWPRYGFATCYALHSAVHPAKSLTFEAAPWCHWTPCSEKGL